MVALLCSQDPSKPRKSFSISRPSSGISEFSFKSLAHLFANLLTGRFGWRVELETAGNHCILIDHLVIDEDVTRPQELSPDCHWHFRERKRL